MGGVKGRVVSSTKEILYLPLKNSAIGINFYYDFKSKLIDSCNLVLVNQLNDKINEFPLLGLASYYQSYLLKYQIKTDLTGTITFYSITNKFQEDFGFKKGNIFRRGFVAPKLNQHKENKIKSNQQWDGCTVWGNFTLWSDGSITFCGGGGGGDQIINYEIWNKMSDSCLKVLVDRLVNSANRVTIPLAKPLIRDVLSESYFASYNLNSSYLA